MYRKPFSFPKLSVLFAFFAFLFFFSGCKKSDEPKIKGLKNFNVRMLVANNSSYGAEHVLPSLQNAWGLAWSTTGTPWVNSQAGHVSDVMDSIGNRIAAVDPVNIPSPTNATGGSPTGIVFNPNSGEFVITSGNGSASQAARFIFVGDDGVVAAWNGTWGHNSFRVAAVPGASYTGLTLASFGGNNYLYAANFATGHIDVWDKNWAPVNGMSFTDPKLPAHYSPFNIQIVGSQLYVTYAKVGDDGEEEHGAGLGVVDVYTTNGMLVRRFASGGTLNAPWGVAMASAAFFGDDDDHDAGPAILVGNLGDGRINAYSEKNRMFLGQLSMHNVPITIDGLWAIGFAPSTSPINPNLLYFTAGPKDEEDGLFGYISHAGDEGHHGH